MVNEDATVSLVRRHFEQFVGSDDVVVYTSQPTEEQNPKITSLLSTASKRGTGQRGTPDYLVEFVGLNLLLVVECKPSAARHQSSTLDQYADYAVDGALLYGSHLAASFDVISVGVSGTTPEHLRVTHHLHLAGSSTHTLLPDARLLTPSDYQSAYRNSPQKQRSVSTAIADYARALNSQLHRHHVRAADRANLIGMIMIALERQSFRDSYQSETSARRVAELALDNAMVQLQDADISADRLDALKQQFSFLLVQTELLAKPKALTDIVSDIYDNITSHAKTNTYHDVLGRMYVEFLRYANSDSSLGIVLTPSHIADLMAELAGVTRDSVVYDSCAGTGGLLVSALKRMTGEAFNDSDKIQKIRSTQLFGVEIQPSIYTLAISNMFIHQDGRSNFVLGNCFDPGVAQEVVSRLEVAATTSGASAATKPNVGLLNPPYSNADHNEWDFVLNNLQALQANGRCVAILPMRCVVSHDHEMVERRRRVLERHTLEGVLSMPDDLFFSSNANVVSCVVVLRAHAPHDAAKKVHLGYCKDDGFTKSKTHGRVDQAGRWDGIREQWARSFANLERVAGVCTAVALTAADEWCAEAHLDTADDLVVDDERHARAVRDYAAFRFVNRLCDEVRQAPVNSVRTTRLADMTWRTFALADLFDVRGSATTPRSALSVSISSHDAVPYVTTQSANNGVRMFVDRLPDVEPVGGGVLTMDSAVNGFCAYQAAPFYASDHVETLVPKFTLDRWIAMFLVSVLNAERWRFNYGRKASHQRLAKLQVRLPARVSARDDPDERHADTEKIEPDWALIREYVRTLDYSASI